MKKSKNQKIICFGEVLWDVLPTGREPGGAPLNVAIHLIRQKIEPILVSKIGNDNNGKDLIQYLQKSELDINFIQTDEILPTSKVLVHLDKNRNATYEICEPVAWDNIEINDEILAVTKDAQIIIYGSLASRNKKTRDALLHIMKNSKAKKFFDVNLRPPYDIKELVEEFLYLSDFVKLNDDELRHIGNWYNIEANEEELIKWLSSKFNCNPVCVTRGEKGAILYLEGKFYNHNGFKVNAVDTVGAGDSFLASLIAQLLNKTSPDTALEFACATGAFVASKKGAVPEYSYRDINKIISQKNL